MRKYFHAAEKIGLDWNQAKYHSRQRLFNELQAKQSSPKDYVIPQFQELARLIFLRKINTIDEAYGVYLMQEQRARHYSRATFHRKYNQWLKNNQQKWEDSYLSHNWVSGQCSQIDYSGDQLTLQVEGVNGVFETRKVDIFVGVLPYSKYLFCYASKDQTRESWLNAIIEMFKFF